MYPSEPTNSPPIPTSSATDVPPTVIQRLNNANEETWLLLGRVAEKMGNSDHALFAYENALRHNPTSLSGLTRIARIKQDFSKFLNNEALAIKHFTNCIEADPSDAQSWYLLGRAYLDNHNYTKASETFWEAVQRDDGNPIFWCAIGALYSHIDQNHSALDAYSRALHINPYISEAWLGLGGLYEKCGNQTSDAITAYTRASSLDPGNRMISNRLQLLTAAQTTVGPLPVAPGPHIRAAQDEHPRVATPAPPVQPLVWTSPFTLSATMPQLPSGIVEEDDHRGRPQGPSDSHSHLPTAHLPPSHPLTIPSGSDIDSSHCIMSGRKAYSPLPEESKRTERSRKTTYLFRKDTQRRVRRNRTSISIQPSPSPFPTTRTVGSASIGMTRKSLRQ
ncbi:hypothetical protein HHX47_DHR1000836 [Lentinula edodes]|nr:hypothetical protein HHX47_DHR1000836 [Lentinula edodes]